jgi:hypothetical protein
VREVSNGNGVCWDVRANIASPTPQQVMAVRLWSSAGCGALCAFRANSLPSGNTPSPSVGPADSLPLVHNAHTRPRAHRYAGSGLDQVVDDIALLVMGGEQQHVLCQQQRGGHCGKREGAVSARSEWGPGGAGAGCGLCVCQLEVAQAVCGCPGQGILITACWQGMRENRTAMCVARELDVNPT